MRPNFGMSAICFTLICVSCSSGHKTVKLIPATVESVKKPTRFLTLEEARAAFAEKKYIPFTAADLRHEEWRDPGPQLTDQNSAITLLNGPVFVQLWDFFGPWVVVRDKVKVRRANTNHAILMLLPGAYGKVEGLRLQIWQIAFPGKPEVFGHPKLEPIYAR